METEKKVEEIVNAINDVVKEIVDSFNDLTSYARDRISIVDHNISSLVEDKVKVERNYLLNEIPCVIAKHMARMFGLKYVDPEEKIHLSIGEYRCIDDPWCIAVLLDGEKAYIINWDIFEKNKATYCTHTLVKPNE